MATLSEPKLVELITAANEKYYGESGNSGVTDEEYDSWVEQLTHLNPKHPLLSKVGTKVKDSVKLPFTMYSLDKIKEAQKLTLWKKRRNAPTYFLSEKLDGVSGLLHNKKLFTRGDGKKGKDVTHIYPFIQGIPKNSDFTVRGEFIMKKSVFEKNKKKHKFSNARNTVAGLLNRNEADHDLLSGIDFVAYEVIQPIGLSPSEQFKMMKVEGFLLPLNTLDDTITFDDLTETLQNMKKESEYNIDGVVVTDDINYQRTTSGNPDYAVAFKFLPKPTNVVTTVTDIEWNVSKDGYWKPTVIVEEIIIDGVAIKKASGYNAKNIVDNSIGIGAKVAVIRSGEVIPKIVEVVSPAKTMKFPPKGTYEWNDTEVDFIIKGENTAFEVKKIAAFFMKMKKLLETSNINVAEKLIEKLYNGGYKSIVSILGMNQTELVAIDGIEKKTAVKVLELNSLIKAADDKLILIASNVLGRGFSETKVNLILANFPNMFTEIPTHEQLVKVDGISDTTAKQFVTNFQEFPEFLASIRSA
jgi:NAD-dependent DNA ligase